MSLGEESGHLNDFIHDNETRNGSLRRSCRDVQLPDISQVVRIPLAVDALLVRGERLEHQASAAANAPTTSGTELSKPTPTTQKVVRRIVKRGMSSFMGR